MTPLDWLLALTITALLAGLAVLCWQGVRLWRQRRRMLEAWRHLLDVVARRHAAIADVTAADPALLGPLRGALGELAAALVTARGLAGTPAQCGKAEQALTLAIDRWRAAARAHPDVALDGETARLSSTLGGMATVLEAAARAYDEAAARLNRQRATWPVILLAPILGVGVAEAFWFDAAP